MAKILPRAQNVKLGKLDWRSFINARNAFKAVLKVVIDRVDGRILLPAYVGWSSREGSGVFDPVFELGVGYDFYRVDRRLRIDTGDLMKKAADERVRAVLLVHWFGFVDVHTPKIASRLRLMGKWVIEDCAHALFSDRVGGICGHLGHASFYSLHKMLPIDKGGLLRINDDELSNYIQHGSQSSDYVRVLAEYDLREIAQQRCENTSRIAELLQPHSNIFEPIHDWPVNGVIPQTWPVLINGHPRDHFYFEMNKRGFGLVSLYHTQIEQIDDTKFPDARWVASRICNLPVHQEVDADQLTAMVVELKRIAGVQ